MRTFQTVMKLEFISFVHKAVYFSIDCHEVVSIGLVAQNCFVCVIFSEPNSCIIILSIVQ
jgi:hypothetical protein